MVPCSLDNVNGYISILFSSVLEDIVLIPTPRKSLQSMYQKLHIVLLHTEICLLKSSDDSIIREHDFRNKSK